ncbi:SDR family NAD(P)-dependent oxidoreductase [Roseococcus sp. YIM B11640]|uniref:SDR family NAD(P)-dependent oxidoreductase n=1 Tax=Roseococcus sp. YIM B11640 TaxID=3133973 RepID=UPI003C7BED8B
MDVKNAVAIVTGGASGLGLATARRLAAKGAKVLIADLATSHGADVAKELGGGFAVADVADEVSMQAAVEQAEAMGPVRVLVHCAGRGGPLRLIEKDGSAGSLAHFQEVIRVNLTGTFNAVRLAAVAMAKTDPIEGERGVCILTASIAGIEGQIGQIPYATSKAGVIGMTVVAARDLASKNIRVCTIAPGIFDTPMLQRLPDAIKASLAQGVPNPHRLGIPDEYGKLAMSIIENGYLNGETIRLDGALRMAPR